MKALLEGSANTAGYARILVDRGEGRTFLKPPRAIREGEDMGEYLLCDRGFVPTITLVVEREMATARALSCQSARRRRYRLRHPPGAGRLQIHDGAERRRGVEGCRRSGPHLRQSGPRRARSASARGWSR